MNRHLLLQLAAGPVFALLTAVTYRAAFWVLGGAMSRLDILWGIFFSVIALLVGWAAVTVRVHPSAVELERDNLREAAEEALAALQDPDTAWTPSGTDARQALRNALGYDPAQVCFGCEVDQGGHSHGCSANPKNHRNAGAKGGVA
ncbi:hypothetical protein [Archangium lansingense]|uniref:Phage holin family protein n=1 Tax=Archangium lansingense TaxID=2995310 RepID=A0ABT4AFB6_9BACT|nr:hypothetical protein [Archangium lansinium]MCY1080320.1 hypothetical protein [Archangium lansinium]